MLNNLSSQCVLVRKIFHPLEHFCGPPLNALQQVHLSAVHEDFPSRHVTPGEASQHRQRGRITSLVLLAMLLLMRPRRLLTFWAVRACCWLISCLLSTSILKSYSSRLCCILTSLSFFSSHQVFHFIAIMFYIMQMHLWSTQFLLLIL